MACGCSHTGGFGPSCSGASVGQAQHTSHLPTHLRSQRDGTHESGGSSSDGGIESGSRGNAGSSSTTRSSGSGGLGGGGSGSACGGSGARRCSSRRRRGGSFLALALAAVAALAAAAPGARADVAVLSDKVLTALPIWARNRSADIVLDFSKADPNYKLPSQGSITYRGKTMKASSALQQSLEGGPRDRASQRRIFAVRYHIGYFHGNVAIVRYGTKFIAAVRKMHFYKTLRTDIENYPLSTKPNEGEISWWASKLAVCSVDSATLQPVACQDYDPRTWKECLWSKGFEGTGPEDPRLIVWPGKGLFMMFGSKPAAINPAGTRLEDTKCEGPWAFQQYLVLLQPHGDAPDPSDPWSNGILRLRYLADPNPDPNDLLKEKNWNPFVFKGKLYFSQQFDPHVVIEPLPNGTCVKAFETSSRVFSNLTTKPRGNTQAVLVPAGFSGEPRDFYLSVVHAEINRSYQNFFYKMQAHPPFRIYSVSRAMPIINAQHPRNLAWTSVSFPMSLDLIPETNQVMIGYGSGDKTPRVKMMPWQEVQALFPANVHESGGAWRYRDRRMAGA